MNFEVVFKYYIKIVKNSIYIFVYCIVTESHNVILRSYNKDQIAGWNFSKIHIIQTPVGICS